MAATLSAVGNALRGIPVRRNATEGVPYRANSAAWKPQALCDPSQNGLFFD
jgi:hypothetical protein